MYVKVSIMNDFNHLDYWRLQVKIFTDSTMDKLYGLLSATTDMPFVFPVGMLNSTKGATESTRK
jgi:hypothetical protein